MTEIYMIRHIQAEGNLYLAMQGHWDGAPTELGLRQAEALAERLSGAGLDALYSSDLTRARMTAGAVGRRLGLPVQTDARLREIDMGRWESRFFGDLQWEEPEALECFTQRPTQWQMDGAESYADVTARAFPALLEIARKNDGKTVAVFSHGVTIRCLLAEALHLTQEQVQALPISGNTAVTRLRYDKGVFSADYINDSSHLEAMHIPAWVRKPALRAEPLDPEKEGDWYAACYADAWRAAHGSLRGFEPGPYLRSAVEHYRADPGSLLRFYCGDEAVGLLEMDLKRGEHARYGWVSLLYLTPDYRRRGLGIQLLGRAVMRYKALGRSALRLHVAEDNLPARAFYRNWGFEELSDESRPSGRLLLLEKKLEGTGHV